MSAKTCTAKPAMIGQSVVWPWLLAGLLSVLVAASSGCSFDSSTLDEARCTTNADCVEGMVCSHGLCVLSDAQDGDVALDTDVEPPDAEPPDVEPDQSLCDGCEQGLSCCETASGPACTNTYTDPSNCGGCGVVCPQGRECQGGTCACPVGTADCDGHQGNGCETNIESDDANCGKCRFACTEANACVSGVCTCVDGACPATSMCCELEDAGPTCVDVTLNTQHCGACGVVCSPGELCVNGGCVCGAEVSIGSAVCGAAAVCCNHSTCSTLVSDQQNCGACGVTCGADQACAGGQCECVEEGLALCAGACVDLSTDGEHCGSCGIACGDGQACVSGLCRCVDTTQTLCGGVCVDTTSDDANCGGCGVTCGAGQPCLGGQCGCADAALTPCGFECVDTDTDLRHCGACGSACTTGQLCCGGACGVLGSAACPATSCLELLESGVTATGPYWVNPDGVAAYEAYCDMDTDGGGWTLAMRTVWDWTETSLLWTDYDTFYGTELGSIQWGHAYRLPGRVWPALQSTNEHLAVHRARRIDTLGDCEPLYYKATAGQWVIPATGSAHIDGVVQPVYIFNDSTFETKGDGTYDGGRSVDGFGGVPWCYAGGCVTCPSYGGGYFPGGAIHPMVGYLTTADMAGKVLNDVCGVDNAVKTAGAPWAVNVLEYYIR